MTEPGSENGAAAAGVQIDHVTAELKTLLAWESDDGFLKLRNGVRLRLLLYRQEMVSRAVHNIPEPAVPMIDVPDHEAGGTRLEENPNDPDYQAALEARDQLVIGAFNRVAYTLGTACEDVPRGMYRPEEDGWLDELDAIGARPPASEIATVAGRYHTWLTVYAMTTDVDQTRVTTAVLLRGGLSDIEVIAAMERFRGNAKRRADQRLAAAAGGRHGDPVRAGASTPRARARGKGRS